MGKKKEKVRNSPQSPNKTPKKTVKPRPRNNSRSGPMYLYNLNIPAPPLRAPPPPPISPIIAQIVNSSKNKKSSPKPTKKSLQHPSISVSPSTSSPNSNAAKKTEESEAQSA